MGSQRRGGLRSAMAICMTMCVIAAALRCVPLLCSEETHLRRASSLIWFVYVAQAINAAAAPFTQASPAAVAECLQWQGGFRFSQATHAVAECLAVAFFVSCFAQ